MREKWEPSRNQPSRRNGKCWICLALVLQLLEGPCCVCLRVSKYYRRAILDERAKVTIHEVLLSNHSFCPLISFCMANSKFLNFPQDQTNWGKEEKNGNWRKRKFAERKILSCFCEREREWLWILVQQQPACWLPSPSQVLSCQVKQRCYLHMLKWWKGQIPPALSQMYHVQSGESKGGSKNMALPKPGILLCSHKFLANINVLRIDRFSNFVSLLVFEFWQRLLLPQKRRHVIATETGLFNEQ